MSLPVLHLDRSTPSTGLYLERDGQKVDMETAFREGFIVSTEDCPAVMTLILEFVRAKGEEGISR